MYKKILKFRTKEAENNYKTYKNKLTIIMRYSKKMYYSELSEKNRNITNIKNTLRVLNKIIKKKRIIKDYSSYFYSSNDMI